MLFERWHILFEINLHVGKKFKSFEPGDKSDSLGLEGSSSSKDSVFYLFIYFFFFGGYVYIVVSQLETC